VKLRVVVALFVLLVSCAASYGWMKEGSIEGQIVTVGDDRVVVASADGGQVTLEVPLVKQGEEWVRDPGQLERVHAMKTGDEVDLRWGQDHTGHYYIVAQAEAEEPEKERPRQGVVTGTVVTTGEGRVVIGSDEGGQVTLEPPWIRRDGNWIRDPFYEVYSERLKPGDRIASVWQLDEGTHFVAVGISAVEPEGQATAIAMMQAELREAQNQINRLHDHIGELHNLVRQLLEKAK